MGTEEQSIARDRYTLNVVAESFSRALSFIGGLVSTTILWRSVAGGSWTTDDYGILKILANVNQILLPLILLGFTGAVVKVVAEYSSDKRNLGRVIGFAAVMITLAYLVTAVVSVIFDLDMLILGAGISAVDSESLRLYWLLVIVTLLPTAYLRLAKSAFSGIQQMKRTLVVDITYNLIRTLTLIYLYFGKLVSIESILVMNLVLGLLASTMAVGLLAKEMRKNEIEWGFKPGREIVRKLGRLASVFLVSALVAANLNNITILWVNAYGTLGDVGLFSIAQGITLTVRMILGAPLVVMGPNLTTEYARGRLDQVERKFREGYRMIVPTYAFAFASIFAFATPILRVIYGADSIAATPFLQLLSFNVIFVVIPGIYTYLYLAADDVRGLFYSSMLQVVIQTFWIVLMAPLIGVIAIASVWVVYIPVLFVQDWYAKSRHGIGANLRQVGAVIVLGVIFAGSMHLCVKWIEFLVEYLPVINLVQAAIVCLAVIPFWYLFISVLTHLRLVNETDLRNMESVLRIVPPAWWFSRPLILRLQDKARKSGD